MIENGVPLKVVSEALGHFGEHHRGHLRARLPDVSAQAMDALGAILEG